MGGLPLVHTGPGQAAPSGLNGVKGPGGAGGGEASSWREQQGGALRLEAVWRVQGAAERPLWLEGSE